MSATPSARFAATAWSCIEAARDPHHPKFRTAVARLITTYWRPVFHFLRAKGHSATDAEDLTQEFFRRCLQPRSPLSRADRNKGRFRDFLRTLVKRFAHDQTVRSTKQTEFERWPIVSVHDLMRDSDRSYEPPAGETPDEAFDKAWKTALLRTVRDNLEAHYAAASDATEGQRFEIFAALTIVSAMKTGRHRTPSPSAFGRQPRSGASRGEVGPAALPFGCCARRPAIRYGAGRGRRG